MTCIWRRMKSVARHGARQRNARRLPQPTGAPGHPRSPAEDRGQSHGGRPPARRYLPLACAIVWNAWVSNERWQAGRLARRGCAGCHRPTRGSGRQERGSLVVIHNISLPPDEFGATGSSDFFLNRLIAGRTPILRRSPGCRFRPIFMFGAMAGSSSLSAATSGPGMPASRAGADAKTATTIR
jgi:hypothetical protein